MGVTLNGKLIPSRIAPDEWASFYEDSLKIIEAGQLADRGWIDIDGIKCMGLVPTRSQEGCWCVAGDLITGFNMDEFMLCQDLYTYALKAAEDNGQDVIYALDHADKYADLRPKTTWFFNGKTQGHRAHMYLLCILCLAAHRFPDAVALSGRITAGQCMRAQEMVKDILGEDISLPLQFDSIALYNRIDSLYPQDEAIRFELFFYFYNGFKDEAYYQFLQSHFSLDVLYNYFYRQNSTCKNITNLARQWQDLELPLEQLCSMVKDRGKTSMAREETMDKTPSSQQYDIITEENLYFWEPGDTIAPELEATLLENLRAVFEQEDTLWKALKDMNKTQRFQAYIIAMQPYNHFPLFTESVLQDMYDHVMDECQGKHDFALVNISVKYDIVYEFVNLMGLNRSLFLYLCQKIDTADNGIEEADS
jgi:hypothetical protein